MNRQHRRSILRLGENGGFPRIHADLLSRHDFPLQIPRRLQNRGFANAKLSDHQLIMRRQPAANAEFRQKIPPSAGGHANPAKT
jgi:hypothetical protein